MRLGDRADRLVCKQGHDLVVGGDGSVRSKACWRIQVVVLSPLRLGEVVDSRLTGCPAGGRGAGSFMSVVRALVCNIELLEASPQTV